MAIAVSNRLLNNEADTSDKGFNSGEKWFILFYSTGSVICMTND